MNRFSRPYKLYIWLSSVFFLVLLGNLSWKIVYKIQSGASCSSKIATFLHQKYNVQNRYITGGPICNVVRIGPSRNQDTHYVSD